jgi:predicted nucleotidyltransferase
VSDPKIRIPQEQIADFCRRWNIIELSLFGSVLREDFRPDSDVDLLVVFAEGVRPSLAQRLDMQEELGRLLGRKVDLVERRLVETSENYLRRRHILNSAEPIYVA